MYVTRPLSLYRQPHSSLSLPPPEGPNSSYIVIQDEESVDTCCIGLCKDYKLRDLPFLQNKMLTVRHPLSSNPYYVIKAHGRHKECVSDVKPKALDHQDIYQQFEITLWQGFCGPSRGGFTAKSVAPDGIPPQFLRRKGWEIYASTPKHYQLGEAQGLDASLRAHLPDLDFTPETKISRTVIVGKDQIKRSMFYEVTLEQQWEQIYACENILSESNTVAIDVYVQKETFPKHKQKNNNFLFHLQGKENRGNREEERGRERREIGGERGRILEARCCCSCIMRSGKTNSVFLRMGQGWR
uniref:Uncharacterized protein n=1 Tax=Nelumbo nucifera TaxID=4432 RepID=A0A822ZJD8_NELNU|nr:TPA_asm: hypothetical protein HUJ06_001356 [Nelumbo nucifera]